MNEELKNFKKDKSTDQYIDMILAHINDSTPSHRELTSVIYKIGLNLERLFPEDSTLSHHNKLQFALETVYNDITEDDSDIIFKIARLRSLANLIQLLYLYGI